MTTMKDESYEIPNNVIESVPAPKVTIRTLAYNHVQYIRDCIEGVLMQETSFPFEYIIAEDNSTDGTRQIVLEYAKKYPRLIRVITSNENVLKGQQPTEKLLTDLLRLGAERILQEITEAELDEFLGRSWYQRSERLLQRLYTSKLKITQVAITLKRPRVHDNGEQLF